MHSIVSIRPRWPGAVAAIVILSLSGCVAVHESRGFPPPSECPQPRFTGKAPPAAYARTNPLSGTSSQLASGRSLYEGKAEPACAICHGPAGDGRGELSAQFTPPPRNFACADTIRDIPDGQLYWIIRNGSPGTAMPAFRKLSDDQVWQLVLYLRQLSEPS